MMKYRITARPNSSITARSAIFKVVLLDNSELSLRYNKKKVFGSELFKNVCEQAGITSHYQQYFGLKYIDSNDGKPSWLNLNEIIKLSLTMTSVFQLVIKVFPKDINDATQDPVLLKHLVYQIKDLFSYGKLRTSVQEHAILDSYFAQAVLGDFNKRRHSRGYLETKLGSSFLVPTSLNTDGQVSATIYEGMVTNLHKSNHSMTSEEAFKEYLRLSTSVFGYGACIYKDAVDLNGKPFILTVSRQGIQIFLPDHFGEPDEVVHEFPWGEIASIMSDGSKFLFSIWPKSVGKRSNSLQMHSFRFPGNFGYLQSERIEKDAINQRTAVLGPQIVQKRERRSKSLDDISRDLVRRLPGRQIDSRLVQSFKLHNKLHGGIPT